MTVAKVVELGAGRSRHFVPITSLASGFELGLTIHLIRGTRPGPAVGISAMIHGDELDGLLIAHQAAPVDARFRDAGERTGRRRPDLPGS